MSETVVGIMHPGEMGASVAAAARSTGCTVLWCDAGRGPRTRERAQRAGLEAVDSIQELSERAQVLLSVCPPHAAGDVARDAALAGFRGVYVDANAVAPATASEVARCVSEAGATFVDGGIIGPPAWKPDLTRLYLAGDAAPRVEALFQGSMLEPILLSGEPFAASSLKMAYAAWTKGSIALLANVRALARACGIEEALRREWELSQPGVEARSRASVTGSAFKAWRWIAEMREIAASFEAAGLPGDFHHGAAEIYTRMQQFKDGEAPDLDQVLTAVLESKPDE